MEKIYDKFTKRTFTIDEPFNIWIRNHEEKRFTRVNEKKLVETMDISVSRQSKSVHY